MDLMLTGEDIIKLIDKDVLTNEEAKKIILVNGLK